MLGRIEKPAEDSIVTRSSDQTVQLLCNLESMGYHLARLKHQGLINPSGSEAVPNCQHETCCRRFTVPSGAISVTVPTLGTSYLYSTEPSGYDSLILTAFSKVPMASLMVAVTETISSFSVVMPGTLSA